VNEALAWFDECYALEAGFGWVRWRRVALPTEGGIDVQPARLLEQMAWIAQVRNAELSRRRPARGGRQKRDSTKRG